MNAPNAELAYQVLDHIDAHPEQWDQGLYIGKAECGTVACFAGWAVLLSGAVPVYSDYTCRRADLVRVDDRTRNIDDYAEELLGARRWIGERSLFDPMNTRDDLGEMVERVFGPRPGGAA